MKIKIFSMATLFIMVLACSSDEVDPDYLIALQEAQRIPISKELGKDQLYLIKTGTIRYEVRWGVDDSLGGPRNYTVHFDDFGLKERSETYNEDGTLQMVQINNGQKTIILDPDEMVARELTEEKKIGTQTRFAQVVKNSGDGAYDWGMEVVADKECDVFYALGDNATIKYGGWGNIIFLDDFRSETWGNYYQKAIEFTEGPVDPKLFQIPEDYTLED